MFRLAGWIVLFALVVQFGAQQAQAQGFVPRGANAALATRDFIVNRPTVSPYLNLLRTQSPLSPPNYQTLVRPALEHRQQQQRQQVAIRRLHDRVSNLQGQITSRNRRMQEGFVTGHPARFLTYLHYYPMLNRR